MRSKTSAMNIHVEKLVGLHFRQKPSHFALIKAT